MHNSFVACFSNECRKYYTEKVRYILNEMANIIGAAVFLFGILFVMKTYYQECKLLDLIKLWQWYVISEVLNNTVFHLETEIRMKLFDNIRSQKSSIWTVYCFRGIIYYIEGTCIFFSLVFIWTVVSNTKILFVEISALSVLAYITASSVLLICIYYLIVCLTIKYKRTSVFVSFITTVMLFLSGMVFDALPFAQFTIFYKIAVLLDGIQWHTVKEITGILIVFGIITLLTVRSTDRFMRK